MVLDMKVPDTKVLNRITKLLLVRRKIAYAVSALLLLIRNRNYRRNDLGGYRQAILDFGVIGISVRRLFVNRYCPVGVSDNHGLAGGFGGGRINHGRFWWRGIIGSSNSDRGSAPCQIGKNRHSTCARHGR